MDGDAAIAGAARSRGVVGDRALGAEAENGQALRIDAALLQRGGDALGTAGGQVDVVARIALVVGMACNRQSDAGEQGQDLGQNADLCPRAGRKS